MVAFADVCLVVLSVWLAYYLRIGDFIYLTRWTDEHFPLPAVAIGLLIIPLFSIFGMYKLVFRYAGVQTLVSVVKAVTVYSMISVMVVTLLGIPGIPRTIGIIQPLLVFFLITSLRLFTALWLGESFAQFFRSQARRNVIIYGAGASGQELANSLVVANDAWPVAFIDDDASLHGQSIAGIKVYPSSYISNLASSFLVAEILLALPNEGRRRRSEIVASLAGSGLSVRTLPSYSDLVQGRVNVSEVRDLSVDEILGRVAVDPDQSLMQHDIVGNAVLVTGAGGSIGSELCRQIILNRPSVLILLEQTEFTLYQVYEELKGYLTKVSDQRRCELVMMLGSVTDTAKISSILQAYNVTTIYHAAAYKHVPIVEENPVEGVRNNILGTYAVAQTACELGVKKFVFISTDKAVRPTSIMGATKRLAELVLQALDQQQKQTAFAMVRFGNVLGSSGSVVPLFRQQIKAGGPVTLTHKHATRYFMTITEAAQLVIQAGAMTTASTEKPTGAPVYLLDMGNPIAIFDLAKRMIELSGFTIFDEMHCRDGDIEIKEIGLRPGEKLHEELLIGGITRDTPHPKIKVADEEFSATEDIEGMLMALKSAVCAQDVQAVREIIASHFEDISLPGPTMLDAER